MPPSPLSISFPILLERYEGILKNGKYVKACNLKAHVGKTITTIGWLVTGKTVHTKNGEPMKFVFFEDTSGLYETVFFPKVYNQSCHMLNERRPYILKGKVEEDFGSVSLTVNWIGFLDRHKTKTTWSLSENSDFCSHLKPRIYPPCDDHLKRDTN
jgi:DNA polymerase III alpha subunit